LVLLWWSLFIGSSCSLPDILQEIAQEEEEKQKRHLRRVIAKEERLKSNPPRLGKRKYVVTVLTVAYFYFYFYVLGFLRRIF